MLGRGSLGPALHVDEPGAEPGVFIGRPHSWTQGGLPPTRSPAALLLTTETTAGQRGWAQAVVGGPLAATSPPRVRQAAGRLPSAVGATRRGAQAHLRPASRQPVSGAAGPEALGRPSLLCVKLLSLPDGPGTNASLTCAVVTWGPTVTSPPVAPTRDWRRQGR